MGTYATEGGKQDSASLPAGISAGVDASQYHRSLGLTKSGLMSLRKSPAHFYQWMVSPPDPSTQAMALGTATHTLVFEPEKWTTDIVIIPEDAPKKPTATQLRAEEPSDKATLSIDWWNDFNEKAMGKTIITQEQLIHAEGMANAVLGNEECLAYLKYPNAQSELSISAIERVKGLDIACKMRCDLLTNDGKVIVDLKTTQDSEQESFSKKFFSLGYWMQAAHYIATARAAGLPVERFIFIAVESSPPYSVAMYELNEKSLEKAFQIRKRLLETLADCIATGKYPSHSKGINHLTMPNWLV